MTITMTDAQKAALADINERWDYVSEPEGMLGSDPCIMVEVKSDSTGCSMWLGIEEDGHTHS